MSNTVFEPIPPPTDSAVVTRPVLTPDQEKMQKDVQAHFTKPEYVIPGTEKGELMEEEKFWLSYECQLRYLRASKWKLDHCIQRLEVTLKWRREFGVYTHVTAPYVEPEAVTGKMLVFGYDSALRPSLYMIPSRQNTSESKRQIEFVVWMLERSTELMGVGVESIALLVNFADKAKNPSMGVARTVLNILQDHYPERLGKALIINVPYLVNLFFKLITPFIDPVTVEKMKFNPNPVKDGLFSPDMIMKEWWGGNQDFKYEHEKYWPKLIEICEARRTKWLDNWRKLGGTIGISESSYKNDVVSVQPALAVTDEKTAIVAPQPPAEIPIVQATAI
ncbi:cral trio domain protein [Moniliophthora roreri MCA 2997]|uniref:Cral trio domain protein n=1 Tax=Moniliophthora roreri (strain MCA 2997) TaxID=1381753 RepID=V2YSN4_MONRO|nr:cral trio domain protein [Moniliophthora roreri MCA 2997]